MSYRAAKQTIQNPVEAEYYGTRLNNSLREGSKSLDPNKVSGNYGFDSEVPKTGMGDNERKGLFSDLERFYRKNNLEVLEEDESPPSDDLEYKKSSKLFKLSLDERVGRKDQPKKGQNIIESQIRKREVGINKTQEKNIASNLEALIKKAPLSQFQNEKTEQSKVDKRMTPEKLKSSSKGLKGDIKKEKESPEKSKATAPKETKKIENNERTPQKSQKMNKGEQVKQDSSPRFKKSSTTNETAPNPNPEPQNSASASPSKKLYLNNFSRPFPLVSPVLSSKNSPHGRPKAISAATTKRVNAGTPKGNEYKSIMAYKTVTKNTATIPSVASGGSTTYTGSFGESDNHVNTLTNENVGENQGKIEKVENIIHNNSHMLENKNLTGDFSQTWTAGSLEAAIQIKQKEVEALKALLEKESKGKIDLTPLRVDTNESEKNSQRKINEKESPVGKQATSTNITKENEVSTKKVFSGQIQGAYGSYALNQLKRTYGTIPIKHSLEKGPLQSKGTFDRLKDKTPPRQTRKNSGVSGLTTATTSTNTTTTIRKSSETGINVINVATAGIPANSKVKSPTNNHVMKGFKIQEPSKEHKSPGKESKDMKNKKAMSLQSKDLREMQLKKKTSKEVRSSKHSREWNVNEVKMMSTEKYTIAEPDCNTKHITHTEGYEQEFEVPLSGPNEGVNEKEIKDVEMVSDNPKAEINQGKSYSTNILKLIEPQEKTEENTNGTPSRKNEGKTEVPGNGKASQRNRNQSNIKIPSSVLKTLGLTLNNRNVKSSLQLLMGETHKNKGK